MRQKGYGDNKSPLCGDCPNIQRKHTWYRENGKNRNKAGQGVEDDREIDVVSLFARQTYRGEERPRNTSPLSAAAARAGPGRSQELGLQPGLPQG